MKRLRSRIIVLSVFLSLSLTLNIVLLFIINTVYRSNIKRPSNTVPNELVGIWESSFGRKVEIYEDGTAYWTYNALGGIYEGYIGVVDDSSLIFTKAYDGEEEHFYQSMSEIPSNKLYEVHLIYDITMHGSSAFSAQNIDSKEYPWSFIKQKE